jgi:uncharacterized protein
MTATLAEPAAGQTGGSPLPAGGICCDLHPGVAGNAVLLPYLEAHWADTVRQRGVHNLDTIGYPLNAPLTCRPDWREAGKVPGSSLERLQTDALDAFGLSTAIANCIYGVQLLFWEDLAKGFCRAINTWLAREWLDKEPRLRASIVIPTQSPDFAVEEIEYWAKDKRFVQVLMIVMDEMPLGRRYYWPIYEAAARCGLPVGIHAGSAYKHPVTPVGWPSYLAEDYTSQSIAFQSMVTSLICEGVFAKFPDLKVVLLESGATWLPAHLWRLTKFWRGMRAEIPWVTEPPWEIARRHIRLTAQPLDAPEGDEAAAAVLERIVDHLRSDEMLLFATDYPHWQYEGTAALPSGLSPDLVRKMMVDNPRATYTRL